MLYNTRKILGSTALSLIVGLAAIKCSYAQGTTIDLIDDDVPAIGESAIADGAGAIPQNVPSLDSSIPAEISLFDDAADSVGSDSGFISPQASSAPAAFDYEDDSLGEFNAVVGAPSTTAPVAATKVGVTSQNLGDDILDQIDSDLFSRMSEIEKQTTLLNLELRRERVKTEIEAIKAQRKKAEQEEREAEEEKKRKQIEWEKEQERKVIEEQRKLQEAQIALENLRQEKVVKAYKATMFEETQKWIEASEQFYEEYKGLEKERDDFVSDAKIKMKKVLAATNVAREEAQIARENYDREISTLQNQISVLKARLEASEAEKNMDKTNPFATGIEAIDEDVDIRLNDEYALLEIRGRGDQLMARLANREGRSFMVKVGTVLQSGHIVDEITQTYIRADKGGKKDFIYFSAGGVLEREPVPNEVETLIKLSSTPANDAGGGFNSRSLSTNQGVPSLSEGMFIKE